MVTTKVIFALLFSIPSLVCGQNDFNDDFENAKQEFNNQVRDASNVLNATAALSTAAIIGINIGALVLIIGCCVLICRCCCGCCRNDVTYVNTTVVSQQPTAPPTQINFGFPIAPSAPGYAPLPSNPVDFGINNPTYDAPPPQYSSK